jgi:LigD-like primase-polymerase
MARGWEARIPTAIGLSRPPRTRPPVAHLDLSAYSPRARPGFPIAVPATWQQVELGLRSDAFSIGKRRERLDLDPGRVPPRAEP